MRTQVTRRYFRVSGTVQGVGYRAFTYRTALRLGLKGYVKNVTDGDVEIVAEGDSATLIEFESQLWRGPIRSEVIEIQSRVVPNETPLYYDFNIVL